MCISCVGQIPCCRLSILAYFIPNFWKYHSYLVLVINANKIKIAEFIQKSMFVRGSPCAKIGCLKCTWCLIMENVYFICSIQHGIFDCAKTVVKRLENCDDLYSPAFGPFNYHLNVKCKCLYQYLVNLAISISMQHIFENLIHGKCESDS